VIEPLLAALRHRGPDGEAAVRLGPALLVHTRLAIIDVAGGQQPLSSEDRACAVVVNGEIYNHRDLRAELESAGHRFTTRSDSEVVVHGYEEWGQEVVRRLNGMFAFALWDERSKRVVVARDPYGIKPLYWWTDGRRVVAASEIGAVLATGLVRAAVDEIALDHFLAWRFVPAPRTLFAGIAKLPPAATLVCEWGGTPRVTRYREPPGPRLDDPSEELERELRHRLAAAVERQMMSDVPYGALLSGGVDSAAIAASMRRAGADPLETFTIGFSGSTSIDEREAARETASALGSRHHDVAMEQAAFPEQLTMCVARLEEPCGISSAPALLQLSRFARRSVKVVLSGQGADEPLGGYQRHQAAAVVGRVPGVLAAAAGRFRLLVNLLPRNERLKRGAAVLGARSDLDRLLRIFEITDPKMRAAMTGRDGAPAAAERERLAAEVLADVPDEGPLGQTLWLDTHLFLPDGLLTYGDKMTMAWGLEQRVPFLDVELMRFVQRLPAELRLRGLRRKALYRDAIRGLAPASALERAKAPFATPYDEWLRDGLGKELARRYAPGRAVTSLVRTDPVQRLLAEHRSGRHDRKRILYCLLELAEWHERFIEEAAC
jgi:asparagine synthase (glutamine-hydrolysing)